MVAAAASGAVAASDAKPDRAVAPARFAAPDGPRQRPPTEAAKAAKVDRQDGARSIPAPSGDDRRAIGEYVRAHLEALTACYEDRLASRPKLNGKLMARFDIAGDGKVVAATADGIDDARLVECVTAVIETWTFEKLSGGTVRVAYPVVFRREN